VPSSSPPGHRRTAAAAPRQVCGCFPLPARRRGRGRPCVRRRDDRQPQQRSPSAPRYRAVCGVPSRQGRGGGAAAAARPLPNAPAAAWAPRSPDVTGKLQLYTEVTREAHEQAKTAQKISYDANKFDVEFDIGDQVLWHCPVGNNHEHFSWYGLYTVSRKINEVT